MAFAPGLAYGRFGYAEVEKVFSRHRGSIRTRSPFVWWEGGRNGAVTGVVPAVPRCGI